MLTIQIWSIQQIYHKYIYMYYMLGLTRLQVVPLSLGLMCVTQNKTAKKMAWGPEARERRAYHLSPRV